MKYSSRLRVRREFSWCGEPLSFNRKLKTSDYRSLSIRVEGLPRTTLISTGQHILIEGDDEDHPYVARVLRLFGDDGGKQKKASVQWFVRQCEIPADRLQLLGRQPHPQEVFYYQGHNCDDEVDVSSILCPVQVTHLGGAEPFPPGHQGGDTLYVKLSWDSKAFRAVERSQTHPGPPSPPPSPPTPPATPLAAPPRPPRRALPTPDPAVISRASSVQVRCSRLAMSAGRVKVGVTVGGEGEAESLHSSSKLSASKSLSARRRAASARTPGVRKRLRLSPEKSATPTNQEEEVEVEVLSRLLDQELEKEEEALALPPLVPTLSIRLIPLRKAPPTRDALPLNGSAPSRGVKERLKTQEQEVVDSSRSPQQPPLLEAELSTSSLRTHGRRQATPRRMPATTRGQKALAVTLSRKREQWSLKEAPLAALAEVEQENSPLPPVEAATCRSSKRKSAQLVSSRIRKQLNLLDKQQDEFSSDGEEEEEFVPTRKELREEEEVEEQQQQEEEEEELDSDQEEEVVRRRQRTPRSQQKKKKSRTPSRKVPPGTPRTPRHATPSIPGRSQPVRQPTNVLEEARSRLHVSAVPESLPCREQEFQDIYSFVEAKIMDGTGGCMYISGVPGTGKTATVQEVIRCLQTAADDDQIPPFSFVEVNGMKMTDPHQAYVQILQKLTGQKATADHAAALLERRFSNPAPRKETTVLLVDELDLLWTRKQNVMYNLFDWPTRRQARLVVLTIANTMDLPERIMINRVASRLGLTRLSFQPYTFKQLQQIITSRLNRLKAFEEDALQLVSRKVAALSGDARRCLDICRRATEICEHAAPLGTLGLVGMGHVMAALDEMFSSSYVAAVRCSSRQEQIFLRAVIAEFRRLGLEEATFTQVLVQHQALCRVEGLQPISVSEGLAVCRRLGACRLLLLEPSRQGALQRVRLNVSQDDVLYALKAD
ncbi:origin recognition complex subunit 1 isoform X1 [Nelusetta ayraudi]|uniref:origin recognition complex subunit 1 isoform X1 n=1 Tax=Nelusetta ayraudi TaxID=303726 RepID=UPI003F6F302E